VIKRFPGPVGAPFDHPWWQGLLGSLLPLLFLLAVVALVVWAVLRVAERRPDAARMGLWSPTGRQGDAALEQARVRYARGEMSREEFLQISTDLQGEPPGATPRPSG
jgi:putative membrane protein